MSEERCPGRARKIGKGETGNGKRSLGNRDGFFGKWEMGNGKWGHPDSPAAVISSWRLLRRVQQVREVRGGGAEHHRGTADQIGVDHGYAALAHRTHRLPARIASQLG